MKTKKEYLGGGITAEWDGTILEILLHRVDGIHAHWIHLDPNELAALRKFLETLPEKDGEK